jgi:urease accessory protein
LLRFNSGRRILAEPAVPTDASLPAVSAAPVRRWEATLSLGYERRGERTVLAHRAHRGPLRVQRDLYPEGPGTCHTLVVHPPGGLAGGDELRLDVRLGAGARALLTTPGATRWYRSGGHRARQQLELVLDDDAVVEWLPQESIFFDGAEAELAARVRLGRGSVYLGWEVLCLGRQASGERFTHGQLRLATELFRGERLLWHERGRLDGGGPLLTSPVGLGGASVCATLLAAAPALEPGTASLATLLAACRAVDTFGGNAGVTCLPAAPGGVLIARWLGDASEAARHHLLALWRVLRPALCHRAATPPRIWAT